MATRKEIRVSDGTTTYGVFSSEAQAKKHQKELKEQGIRTRLYIKFLSSDKAEPEEPVKKKTVKREPKKGTAPPKKKAAPPKKEPAPKKKEVPEKEAAPRERPDAAPKTPVPMSPDTFDDELDIDVANCSIHDFARFLYVVQETCIDRRVWTDNGTQGKPYPVHSVEEIGAILSNPTLAPDLCKTYLGCYITRFASKWGGWDESTVSYNDWKDAEVRLQSIMDSALKVTGDMMEEPEKPKEKPKLLKRKDVMTVPRLEDRVSHHYTPGRNGGRFFLEGAKTCYAVAIRVDRDFSSVSIAGYERGRISGLNESTYFRGADSERKAIDWALQTFLDNDEYVAVLSDEKFDAYNNGEWAIGDTQRLSRTDFARSGTDVLAQGLYKAEMSMVRHDRWTTERGLPKPVYSEGEIAQMLSDPPSAGRICGIFLDSSLMRSPDSLDVWFGGPDCITREQWLTMAERLKKIQAESQGKPTGIRREKPSFFKKRNRKETPQSVFNRLDGVFRAAGICDVPAFDSECKITDPAHAIMMEIRSTDGRSIFGFRDDGSMRGAYADLKKLRENPKEFTDGKGSFSEQAVMGISKPGYPRVRVPELTFDSRFIVDADSFKRELGRAERFVGSDNGVMLYADGNDLMMASRQEYAKPPSKDDRKGGMRADVGDVWQDGVAASHAEYTYDYLVALSRLMQAADSDCVVEFSTEYPIQVTCRVANFEVRALLAPIINNRNRRQ